ncbi:MAG TPA: hypothetical protein VFH77_16330 [Streptomyces sp.]|nr:hypothetical protein [Streptomyces sp.]
MTGRAEPPEGTPDGAPGGGDDEYRSVVFDESFVEAARLQEYSAAERLQDDEHAAVHDRPPGGAAGRRRYLPRQGIALVVLIVIAFATAVYMGVRSPYPPPEPAPVQPMRVSMLPLAPQHAVPGGTPADLFAHSPAKELRKGADGITMQPPHSTAHFSESQIQSALSIAKRYLYQSAIDPAVLTGDEVREVRLLLNPGQQPQFDRSVENPRSDGRHAATGWMIRFDPDEVELAAPQVRVEGTMNYREAGSEALDVTADHVFVYALRPAGDSSSSHASLFTVRREMSFHFERSDLRNGQLRVRNVELRAGPAACSSDQSEYLRPLLAGEKAGGKGPAGTDPYSAGHDRPAAVCGELADSAQPHPSGERG